MTQKKPNVLVLFTDDQRFDTIAALGNQEIKTPNLDRLAGCGVAFTRAHIPGGTSGAVCMPSRAMLHTGRTLFHLEGAGHKIPVEHALMGEVFRNAGYRTFGTGKWHNGKEAYARSFTDGDEIFFGGMADHWNVPVNHFDPTGKYEKMRKYCGNPFYNNHCTTDRCDHIHPGEHSSDIISRAVTGFIDGYDSEDPFFIYTSFLAPHDPRVMPDEFRDMYKPEEMKLPENFASRHAFDIGDWNVRDEVLEKYPRTEDAIKKHIAEYYGIISHMDHGIGQILDSLERSGKMDNTIIVMAGDNGLALGQHGLLGKQNLYEHSVRVPLIFAGPGLPEGVKNDGLVYLLDIFPTLCELCGLTIPSSVDGQSLAATLMDAKVSVRDDLYLAYLGRMRGLTDGDYKLIEYVIHGEHTMTQLFDLKKDPFEMSNLADDAGQTGRIEAMRARMRELSAEWDDPSSKFGMEFWSGMS